MLGADGEFEVFFRDGIPVLFEERSQLGDLGVGWLLFWSCGVFCSAGGGGLGGEMDAEEIGRRRIGEEM